MGIQSSTCKSQEGSRRWNFLPGPSGAEGLCRPGSQLCANFFQVDSLQTLLDGPSLLVCAGNEAFRRLEMENDRGNRTRMVSGVTARSERGEWVLGLPSFFHMGQWLHKIGTYQFQPHGKGALAQFLAIPAMLRLSCFFLFLSALTEQSITGGTWAQQRF